MPTTVTELALTPVYRHAQRSISEWLEGRGASSRRQAFRARAALAQLQPGDRHRMARWLAWLCAVDASRGQAGLVSRIRRLDASLHGMVHDAIDRLPAIRLPTIELHATGNRCVRA